MRARLLPRRAGSLARRWWNSNSPIRREFRRNHHVGRVAREPRAGNAILGDVEGVDHHRRNSARPVVRLAEKLPADQAVDAEDAAEAIVADSAGTGRGDSSRPRCRGSE